MGKPQLPAFSTQPLQLVGEERYWQTGRRQNRAHHAVEAIGYHDRQDVPAPAEPKELGKFWIDVNLGDDRIDLIGCGAEQIHLALHAFTRCDTPALPKPLDLAPGGVGKALEESIRRIIGSDRAVEINEDVAIGGVSSTNLGQVIRQSIPPRKFTWIVSFSIFAVQNQVTQPA